MDNSRGRSRGDRRKNLWLKDGDSAKFWFVTDGSEVILSDIHIVEVNSGGRTFSVDQLCIDNCTLCAQGMEPFERWYMWVYVEAVAHAQNTNKDWKKSKIGMREVFVEEVNAIWLFSPKSRLSKQVREAYATYGTLLDRRWKVSHTGSGGTAQDVLIPESEENPMPIPGYVTEAASVVGSLEEYVVDQFSPRGGGGGSTKTRAKPESDDAVNLKDISPDELVSF